MRAAELGLFLVPFALYGMWLLLRRGGGPSPAVVAATLVALGLVGAGLVGLGIAAGLGPGRYVPARFEDGRIVPGHAQ